MMKRLLLILAILCFVPTACCLVDEDFSGCPDEGQITYEMRLITNVQTEINTVLDLEADIYVAEALREHLKNIFTDYAHDVDLSFYDSHPPRTVLHHISDIIDASQTSYTLRLPVYEYMHLAVANLIENPQVSLEGAEVCEQSHLLQKTPDIDGIVDSHTTGLFTARLPMEIKEGIDQNFDVKLYMANCATALVLDRSKAQTLDTLLAYTTGFAESFSIEDSTFVFNTDPLVRAVEVPVEEGPEVCYATVQFPSREPKPDSKVVIETTDPFIAQNADEILWEWVVYVRLDDGSITESKLGLVKPLRAGQLKIIKAFVTEGGVVTTKDPNIAVSVTMDWNSAGSHQIPL